MRLAQLDGVVENAEEAVEQRELRQHGQAAAVHVDALLLVERHDLGVHLGLLGVVHLQIRIALFDGVDLGLNAHHLERRLHHHEAQRDERDVEDGREQDDGPAPTVGTGADGVANKAQGEIKRFGDVSQPTAELDERMQRGTVGFAVGPSRVDKREDLRGLGAGKQTQAGIAAGVADGEADHIDGSFLAVRIAGIGGQVDGVVQRDDRGAIRRIGQECGGKVKIHYGRVLIRRVQRVIAADLGGGLYVIPVIDRPGKEGGSGHLPAQHGGLMELLHVAQAGGPFNEGAHGHAIALHLGFDADHVARIKAEGFHGIDAVGRVFKSNRRRRKEQAGGRGLRAAVAHLVKRVVQLRGERRLIGEE